MGYHADMKLTAQIKLLTTPEQHAALLETLRLANAACNDMSARAWETRTFGQYGLHRLVYHDVRQRFALSAQVVISCISKVSDAYKQDQKVKRTFKPTAAVTYDSRILTWAMSQREVSIWSVKGRLAIPFVCGERQWALLQTQRGETDLVYVNGVFYLLTTCQVDEPASQDVDRVLGVDVGIVNIATDSDGESHSGSQVKSVRHRHRRLRKRLQKRQTDAARRRLKKLAGKERRFAKNVNHTISKRLVEKAQRAGRGIALEDLAGIRDRVRARKPQRSPLHSWSFHDLGQKIAYKAQLAGVSVFWVDPRHTSRLCPTCGHCDKHNRPNQSTFQCVQCGYAAHADYVAAVNIGRRAVVNPPNVGMSAEDRALDLQATGLVPVVS
jgi:IS605 OrfB family transposase